jgi:hypothetical protein
MRDEGRKLAIPWFGLLLIWNSLGGLCAFCFDVFCILVSRYSIGIPLPPEWCGPCLGAFFWFWFLPLPFTTLGVSIFLWRSRKTTKSKLMLLLSFVNFALWSGLIAMFAAFALIPI